MTKTDLPPAQAPLGQATVPPRTKGWIKALLVASLALNLTGIGLTAGAYLRGGAASTRSVHDMGLGPLTAVMTRADWKAMRPAFIARHPDLKGGPAALRADFDPILAALRADPFDPVALDGAVLTVAGRNADRLESARLVVTGYLQSMPPEDRRAFADRLQAQLDRPPEARPPEDRGSRKDRD